jgi:hypothetical protein
MELVGYYAELDADNVVTQVITGVLPTETIEGLPAAEWYSNFTGVTCVLMRWARRLLALSWLAVLAFWWLSSTP